MSECLKCHGQKQLKMDTTKGVKGTVASHAAFNILAKRPKGNLPVKSHSGYALYFRGFI